MMSDINLELIQQRKVRKYVECQIEEGKQKFSDIHPSWDNAKDLSSYSKQEKTFFLNGCLEDIWQGYVSANLSDSWNGRKISFGLLLRTSPCNIFYNHDPIYGVDTGQVYFLNLKIMLGIINIPVAFEIITLDTDKKIIEFSYIEGNKSKGIQQIKFTEIGGGLTEIRHTSYYRSDSHFRDKWIYPYFHELIVNDFHRNMKRMLIPEKKNKKPDISGF